MAVAILKQNSALTHRRPSWDKGRGRRIHDPPLHYVRGEQLTRGGLCHSTAAGEYTHWFAEWDADGTLPSVCQGPVYLGEEMPLCIFPGKEAQQ